MFEVIQSTELPATKIVTAKNVFSKTECQTILDAVKTYRPAYLWGSSNAPCAEPQLTRSLELAYIENLPKPLHQKIIQLQHQVNETYYHYELDMDIGLENYLAHSIPGDVIAWHTDCEQHSYGLCRKLIMTMQVKDPATYQGGVLQLEINQDKTILDMSRDLGSVVFFSAAVSHRLTPVEDGVAEVFVSRAYGPYWGL